MNTDILSILCEQMAARPDKAAFCAYEKVSLSYTDLYFHIEKTSITLQSFGVKRGFRLGIIMPGGPEMATLCLAVMSCATAVPINPDYKLPEYSAIFLQYQLDAVIMLGNDLHPAKGVARQLGLPVFEICRNDNQPTGVFDLNYADDNKIKSGSKIGGTDIVLLLQTSGTTSKPKRVPLSFDHIITSAYNLIDSLELNCHDRCLHFLPMYHIGGIVDVLLAPLFSGGSVIFLPSYSSPEFFRDLLNFEPTWTQAVPIMLQEILQYSSAQFSSCPEHHLKFVRSVSAPLSIELMDQFETYFNVPVIEIFGMTEAAGVITSNPIPPGRRVPGSVGLPIGSQVKLINHQAQSVSVGEVGEVWIKGKNVINNYEEDDQNNRDTYSFREGWFFTGDLGRFDEEGYLYLCGRSKELINRGGEKVSPYEIEQVLITYQGVIDCACFSIPHATLGEEVAAVYVLDPPGSVSSEELILYLKSQLAFFKAPKYILEVSEIPRSTGGKLKRQSLTEKYGDSFERLKNTDTSIFIEPNSVISETLAKMWADLLNMDKIGLHDDFFLCGGDSLAAASFINDLQQKWGDTIYVSSVFDAPTIAQYEQFLKTNYPIIVARMMGKSIMPEEKSNAKVSNDLFDNFKASIVKPKPAQDFGSEKNPSAIFVLSPPRSGSTLLRAIMAGHPQLFSPPELYLLTYNDLQERKSWYSGTQKFQLEGNYRALMQLQNKPLDDVKLYMDGLEEKGCSIKEYYSLIQNQLNGRLLVDKTPAYSVHIETLEKAELYFDNVFYIHLLRHPYGMIRSFEEAKLEQLWYPRLVGNEAAKSFECPYTSRQLGEMIWLLLHQNIINFLKKIPKDRQFQLRFESLVTDPESVMRDFCIAKGLEFFPDMLNAQENSKQRMTDGVHSVSKMIGDPKFHQYRRIEAGVADQWKTAYEIDFLSTMTCDLAQELGYEETVASVTGRQDFEI